MDSWFPYKNQMFNLLLTITKKSELLQANAICS